jgi:hypothetical protein
MSRIDPTKPVFGNPTTASVRDNFAIAKSEIEGLEASKAPRTELANYLPLAGGVMTGPITLAADPTAPTQPATMRYVDAAVANLDSSATGRFLPLAGGTMTGPLVLAADPAAPMQPATRNYVDNAPFLRLAGGAMTGPLLLAGGPATANGAATRQFVEDTISGAVGVTEAPEDGRIYARGDRAWHLFGAVPVGGMLDWPSRNIPPRWLLCDGRELSRTQYSQLFAAVGTDWGEGDGETSFNLPDFRGRGSIGLDVQDSGGNYAQRVTATISGIDATAIGAAGGDERMHAHGHDISDPTHGHGVADGGHNHNFPDPGHAHGVSDGGHSHYYENSWIFGPGGGGQLAGAVGDGFSPGMQGAWTGGAGAGIGIWAGGTGRWIDAAGTGIGIYGSATNIAVIGNGAGTAQNMPPSVVCPKIIYAGV